MLLPPGTSCILASLYEFLFTPICCHCEAPLAFGERFLCGRCSGTLLLLEPSDPFYLEARRRLTGDGTFDHLVSLFRFEKGAPIQSLLHELKYGGQMGVGLVLGRRLGSAVGSVLDPGEFSGCVPVPLHPVRRRERGYNQCALLCRGLAGATGVPGMESLLKRTRPTPSQTSLGVGERMANVDGAFACRRRAGRRIAGGSLLLVDDVLTTGATLRACGMVLRRAGVRRLVACTTAIAAKS